MINRKKSTQLILMAFIGLIFFGFQGLITTGQSETSNPIKIAVSIVPQVEWLQEIGGDKVEVLSLIPAGQSPHSYAPTTTELTFVSNASVWFQMGLIEFDIAHKQAINQAGPSMQIINLSVGLELIHIDEHQHEQPSSAEDEHEPGAYDPHTWLSPTRVIQMVNIIAEKMAELDPSHANVYTTNAANYITKLTTLNNTISNLMNNVVNKNMLIFHPSYGYFCHDFGLKMIPLEEDGQDPSSQHYAEVLDEVKDEGVGVIFIQAEFSQSMAESFSRDAGVEIVRLYPLAHDYIENMNSTGHLVAEKLEQPPSVVNNISSFTIFGILLQIGVGIFLISKSIRKRDK